MRRWLGRWKADRTRRQSAREFIRTFYRNRAILDNGGTI